MRKELTFTPGRTGPVFSIIFLTLGLLAGCAGGKTPPTLTATASGPASIASAIPSKSAPPPASLPQPAAGVSPATAAAAQSTLTPAAAPGADFPGAALILSPGDSSRLVSPLTPQILVRVHPEGIIHVDLVGKSDLLYARHLVDLSGRSGEEVFLQPELPFEVQGLSEPARLVVRLLDNAGRTIALTSSNLTLLSSGRNEILPHSAGGWVEVITPLEGEVMSGKEVEIIASVSPINEQPIVAELVTEEGTAINTRLVNLPAGTKPGDTVQLNFTLPYAVNGTTPCLLTLYQASYNQIEGTLMLVSVPLTLMP